MTADELKTARTRFHPFQGHACRVMMIALLLISCVLVHAQEEDRPEEEADQPAEDEQLLEDFGGGLRAFAALLDDSEIGIDELKELYAAAEDALSPDVGMAIYLDGYEDNQQQDELAGFREEIIDLHYTGSISRGEALSTWLEVIDVRFFHKFKNDGVDWSDRMLDADRTGNLAPIRLRIPDAGDVRTLIRPEFLMRDLKFFSRELELDEATRAIIETLLQDYVTTYERRAEELKDAIRAARTRYGKETMLARVKKANTTLDMVSSTIDWTEMRDRIDEKIEDAERQVWMANAVDRFEGSINAIREAIDRRRVDLDRAVATPQDGKQALKLAKALQADRRGMREDLVRSMVLVLDEEQRQALDGIFDSFILEQARIDSKLGGSRINLELAIREALGETMMSEETRDSLDAAMVELLQLVDRWNSARMDRERSGLELFVAYGHEDDSGIRNLTENHGQRARSELSAAISIRDRLIAGQSELEGMIAKSDPEAAGRFSRIARAQGFAPQVRTRWSEHAISAVESCEDLDEERRNTVLQYASDLTAQLEPIRMQAIQIRVATEPRIAQARIDGMLGRKSSVPIGVAGWREPGAEQFGAVDEQIDSRLQALLTGMECAEALPRRRGKTPPEDPNKKNGGERRGR